MSERLAGLDHTTIGVSDVAKSAAFCDVALAPLGLGHAMELPDEDGSMVGIGYGGEYPVFWIDRYHPFAHIQHTAFAATSREQVDAFHAAGLKAGGTDNGAGDRAEEWTPEGEELTFHYYAAFVLDPDGNNIEAVYRG